MSEGRDWGWTMFVTVCVVGVLVMIGVGIYVSSPYHETKQEHLQRIDREINDLQQRVYQLEQKR